MQELGNTQSVLGKMKLYLYFNVKTQFSQIYIWAVFFPFGGRGWVVGMGGGGVGQITMPFILDICTSTIEGLTLDI